MGYRPEAAILKLLPHQFYPDKKHLTPEFFKNVRYGLLSKDMPIASMGSCFAREVKDYLVEKGYNYIQVAQGPDGRHASAAWGRVYNTFCIRQEFERALGGFEPVETHWLVGGQLQDPYRTHVLWKNGETMAEELAEHKRTASIALRTAQAMVITIGINEIWYNREDGAVFFHVPPADAFDPSRHAFRLGTFQENLANLERVYELLQQVNPDCKLIVSMSPVPLRTTFREDADVVVASIETKSLLLAVTKEFVRRSPNAYYFPGYEITHASVKDPFEMDARHVRREVIHKVMEIFDYQFLK